MELFIKNTPKVLVFVLLFFSLSAYSQERNYYPFQQYYEPYMSLFGDTSEEVCHQIKAEIVANNAKNDNIYTFDSEYIENEFSVRPICKWDMTNHGTSPPDSSVNSFTFSIPILARCQKQGISSNPNPYLYISPFLDYSVQSCYCTAPRIFNEEIQWCTLPPDLPKDNCNTTNNPCQVSTGAKFRNEVDFADGSLGFNRRYHSQNLSDQGFGKGWHNAYLKNLLRSGDNHLSIVEGSGRGEPWRKVNGTWQGDADSDYVVTETPTGFTVTNKFKQVSDYDSEGRLLTETDAQGRTQSYAYDSANRLIQVTNHYGLSIGFAYSTNGSNATNGTDHITRVTDSANVEYHYEYDSNDNLVAVIYPDTTPEDQTDNPRKIYHYENPDFPNHLTGITDENGDRYATFEYDSNGKAIVSELGQTTNAVGQQRVELNY